MKSDLFEVACEYARIVRDSTNSHGRPNTHVKRDNIIAVLTYRFGGTEAFGSGIAVTREMMEAVAAKVGGTYELNPARIVFERA